MPLIEKLVVVPSKLVGVYVVLIRSAVFSTEIAGLDTSSDPQNDKPDWLSIMTLREGNFKLSTNASSLSVTDLKTKWTSHSDGCSDCEGWSL